MFEDCQQVIKLLRQDVPRPKVLPTPNFAGICLKWFPDEGQGFCPMGLHPKACHRAPYSGTGDTRFRAFRDCKPVDEFPAPTAQVVAFADVWDQLTILEYDTAIKEIWG
jgi:hypothetical protein